jgi:hypothetical protein
MRTLTVSFALIVGSALLPGTAMAQSPAPIVLPVGQALTDAIRKAEGDMFTLFFDGCNPDRLATMLVPDLEFYHDKSGVAATSAAQFVGDYAKTCEARKKPDAWRSRREVVSESLHVDPVPGYGAIEAGSHLFYERQGDGPEKLVGKAAFTMLWKRDGDTWKLARVMSYGHEAVK